MFGGGAGAVLFWVIGVFGEVCEFGCGVYTCYAYGGRVYDGCGAVVWGRWCSILRIVICFFIEGDDWGGGGRCSVGRRVCLVVYCVTGGGPGLCDL